jgi:hypothetical protein
MNCREMVEAMQGKGYWQSPTGKTPEATLYASILRNIRKGNRRGSFVSRLLAQAVFSGKVRNLGHQKGWMAVK